MSRTVTFAACQIRHCLTIFIINDLEVENEESFMVVLERTPDLKSNISINPTSGDVIINSDDGMLCRAHGHTDTHTIPTKYNFVCI